MTDRESHRNVRQETVVLGQITERLAESLGLEGVELKFGRVAGVPFRECYLCSKDMAPILKNGKVDFYVCIECGCRQKA